MAYEGKSGDDIFGVMLGLARCEESAGGKRVFYCLSPPHAPDVAAKKAQYSRDLGLENYLRFLTTDDGTYGAKQLDVRTNGSEHAHQPA
jgi:hypothetical protein